ncbi:uncharacterized protein LOC128203458 isoform X2 [Mya arenaria]|uniref:uncharacterized protein LOC128203458 isoform X2 n=1 Tax=Mya arenaria TaxID=6604 RepID=UPI0022E8C4CA|nr:uncharacterized protein LOC128203458 isoform X2 [Mya arenaria]
MDGPQNSPVAPMRTGYTKREHLETQPGIQSELEGEEKPNDSSSLSSFLTYSNFTMSCSGGETQEDNEPSTSGCSSVMPHKDMKRSKNEKKERVKQYLKELKTMVQPDGRGGTLSALQQVLTNMRKMKGMELAKTEKMVQQPSDTVVSSPCARTQTLYDSLSHESLTSEALKFNDEIIIYLTACDNMVRGTSNNLQTVLGYNRDHWAGRSLDNFLHRADIATYRSILKKSEESLLDQSDGEYTGDKYKAFYIRLRECKRLGATGFSLRKKDKYLPFQCSFARKKMCKREMKADAPVGNRSDEISSSGYSGSVPLWGGSSPSDKEGSGSDDDKWYTVLHCMPMVSPYTDVHMLPDVTTFETRQTLFCSFCHIGANTIALLGYLPQEIVGVSIFKFFHDDDLQRLFSVYQKVIALKGVPYKSGAMRILAKNGCYIMCVSEWSSFVNPWTKTLEFIIGKHTVVKGPENPDVFSENFLNTTVEETPHAVLLARQKIKNLLLQPVESIYLEEDSESSLKKGPRQSHVAIAEENNQVSLVESSSSEVNFKKDTLLSVDPDKQGLHGTGILFKENAILRAYEQLSYTSCIKKFLLSMPQCFSSDSEAEGFDDDSKAITSKPIGKWINTSIDDLMYEKHVKMSQMSEETRSLPALNDTFWKSSNIISSEEYDFDIRVPKPPSFGSSTKVLVSEQEHRDIENLLDPVNIRDSLKHGPTLSETHTEAETSPVMHLTRESLWKHTLLQEQLYLASASPERNVLFLNECRDNESYQGSKKRNALKRIHSPDMSLDRCKSGRNSEGHGGPTQTSILNPIFPLVAFDRYRDSYRNGRKEKQVVVPMQMFPIVATSSGNQGQMNPCITESSGMCNSLGVEIRQGEMMGFQSRAGGQTRVTNLGLPIPRHQLNSYLMQQGNMLGSKSRPCRKQQEKIKSELASSDTSSMEETMSSFYVLETTGDSVRQTYNQLVLQSLAQQVDGRSGLDPASWLQLVNFTDTIQYRFQLQRPKHRSYRLIKKFQEQLQKVPQPLTVLDQIDEVMAGLDGLPLVDQEQDYLIFGSEPNNLCSCVESVCCRGLAINDHGITKAYKRYNKKGNKKGKKKEKLSKDLAVRTKNNSMQTEQNFTMEVDDNENDHEADCGPDRCQATKDVLELPFNESTDKSSKCGSCCSNKSEEGFLQCDMSVDSGNSLNASDITPSDQRSNNENGSSLKESDADAMSKKSDSSSCDKQTSSSDSESDIQNKCYDDIFKSLFTDLSICFRQWHSDMVPWLVNVDFDDKLQMNYHMGTQDQERVLQHDRTQLEALVEPELVQAQLRALMEEVGSNIDFGSVMLGDDPSPMVTEFD